MSRAPFTASQWQELELQALIFKYLMAGIPVPSDLVLPIRKSLESMAARFYHHHPTMGYCSFYGKKIDPEPGRCRRTDGKKWRCSKDAYPDSKYCERHMHRGRNRSRKPVESQTINQSSATVSSVIAGGSGGSTFQNLPLQSFSNPQGPLTGSNSSQFQVDPATYGISNKEYRYMKGYVDENRLFSDASGSVRGLGMDSSIGNPWLSMPSKATSFPSSKPRDASSLDGNYTQLHAMGGLGHANISPALSKQQQQHSFFGNEFGSSVTVKQEGQSLRPFFDELPKARDSWSDLEDGRSSRTSFSTTQLSISIPMSSSDFSAESSRSPTDE